MTRAKPIVAIDGPVGAGKSTVARALARELGFRYLNTGAMYRAVAIAASEAGLDLSAPDLEAKLAPVLAAIRISFEGERIVLGGADVTERVTDPAISDLASRLSALGAVRARMRELQRAAGGEGGVVMEGRDIGTAIFPDAEFKFFLDADVAVRARRRYEELAAKGASISYDQVFEQLRERDARDSSRVLAPLKRADDAIVVDSTALDIPAVTNAIKEHILAATNAGKGLKRS
ncbi:MAG: (d)CMP kinase [Candidatus Binataceae bacterium]